MSFFVDSLLLPFSVVDISYLSIWIWFHLGAFFFFFRYVVSVIFFFWQYRVITCVYLIMTTGGPSWSFFSFSSHIFFLIYLIFLISAIMIRFFFIILSTHNHVDYYDIRRRIYLLMSLRVCRSMGSRAFKHLLERKGESSNYIFIHSNDGYRERDFLILWYLYACI